MREQLLLRPISLITQIRTKYEQNQEKNINRYAYMRKGDDKRTADEGIYEASTSNPIIAEDLKIHNKGKTIAEGLKTLSLHLALKLFVVYLPAK